MERRVEAIEKFVRLKDGGTDFKRMPGGEARGFHSSKEKPFPWREDGVICAELNNSVCPGNCSVDPTEWKLVDPAAESDTCHGASAVQEPWTFPPASTPISMCINWLSFHDDERGSKPSICDHN